MPTLNWVFENQPIVTGILTEPSSRKQFASRRKIYWKRGGGSYLYIHLYYRYVLKTKVFKTKIVERITKSVLWEKMVKF